MSLSSSSRKKLDDLAEETVRDISIPFPNEASLVEVFVKGFIALLQDSPIERKPVKVLLEALKTLRKLGLLGFIGELAQISDHVTHMYAISGTTDHTDVLHLSRRFPFFKEILAYSRDANSELLRYLLSLLLFGKKLKIDNPAFTESAFRGWSECEDHLSKQCFDERSTNALSNIVGWLVHPILFKYRRFKNGPGKVAERGVSDVYGKVRLLRDDCIFSRTLKEVVPRITSRTSRLKMVPKDVLKGYRSICMEPTVLMYIQQGTLDALLRTFRSSNIRYFVDLSDQDHNRRAAISGSIDGETATLDLSSASDLVHLDLVAKVFPSDLKDELLVSRSVDVDTSGKTPIYVNKFAPMGSALCFPVECILFTAIGLYSAIRKSDPDLFELLSSTSYERGCDAEVFIDYWYHVHYTRGRKFEASSSLIGSRPLRVYGDDICCDRHFVDEYIEDLTRFGFRVNVSKSFYDMTSVRESCGIYAFEGADVTPLRLLVGKPDFKSPRTIQSYISLANRSFVYGFNNLRRYIYGLLKYDDSGRRRPIPHTEDQTLPYAFHLDYVFRDTNSHLEKRYNEDLQRLEHRVLRSKDVREHGDASHYLYSQALRYPSRYEEDIRKRGSVVSICGTRHNPSRTNAPKDSPDVPWRGISRKARVDLQWITGLP